MFYLFQWEVCEGEKQEGLFLLVFFEFYAKSDYVFRVIINSTPRKRDE